MSHYIRQGEEDAYRQQKQTQEKAQLEIDKLKEEIKNLKNVNADYKIKTNVALIVSVSLALIELLKYITSLL